MDNIVKYKVKRIMEPDYGCEECPKDYVAMDEVVLSGTDGNEISIQIADKELYDKDINEGDWVCFDIHNDICKEK